MLPSPTSATACHCCGGSAGSAYRRGDTVAIGQAARHGRCTAGSLSLLLSPTRQTPHNQASRPPSPVQLAAVSGGPTCLASWGRAAT